MSEHFNIENKLALSIFPAINSHTATVHKVDWPATVALLEGMAAQPYPAKIKQPLIKMGRFQSNTKSAGSQLLSVSGIMLDIDKGEKSFSDAVTALTEAGVNAFVYTTASDAPESPCYRVLLPLSENYPPARLAEITKLAADALGIEVARESLDVNRCYFIGSVEAPSRYKALYGDYIDQVVTIPSTPPVTPIKSHPTQSTSGGEWQMDAELEQCLLGYRLDHPDGIHNAEFVRIVYVIRDEAACHPAALVWLLTYFATDPKFDEAEIRGMWARDVPDHANPATRASLFAMAIDEGVPNFTSHDLGRQNGFDRDPKTGLIEAVRIRDNDGTASIKPPTFLWDGVCVTPSVSVHSGKGGAGKTLAAIAIAAIVSRGGTFPDGSTAQQGMVVIMCADHSRDQLLRKARANGADMRFIKVVDTLESQSGDFVDTFQLNRDLGHLAEFVRKCEAKYATKVRLVILDTISYMIKAGGSGSDQNDVMEAMAALNRFAHALDTHIWGLLHNRKGGEGDLIDSISGSAQWLNRAMAAFSYGYPKEKDGGFKRIVCCIRNQEGEMDWGYPFDIRNVVLSQNKGELELLNGGCVSWGAKVYGEGEELMARTKAEQGGGGNGAGNLPQPAMVRVDARCGAYPLPEDKDALFAQVLAEYDGVMPKKLFRLAVQAASLGGLGITTIQEHLDRSKRFVREGELRKYTIRDTYFVKDDGEN